MQEQDQIIVSKFDGLHLSDNLVFDSTDILKKNIYDVNDIELKQISNKDKNESIMVNNDLDLLQNSLMCNSIVSNTIYSNFQSLLNQKNSLLVQSNIDIDYGNEICFHKWNSSGGGKRFESISKIYQDNTVFKLGLQQNILEEDENGQDIVVDQQFTGIGFSYYETLLYQKALRFFPNSYISFQKKAGGNEAYLEQFDDVFRLNMLNSYFYVRGNYTSSSGQSFSLRSSDNIMLDAGKQVLNLTSSAFIKDFIDISQKEKNQQIDNFLDNYQDKLFKYKENINNNNKKYISFVAEEVKKIDQKENIFFQQLLGGEVEYSLKNKQDQFSIKELIDDKNMCLLQCFLFDIEDYKQKYGQQNIENLKLLIQPNDPENKENKEIIQILINNQEDLQKHQDKVFDKKDYDVQLIQLQPSVDCEKIAVLSLSLCKRLNEKVKQLDQKLNMIDQKLSLLI